MCYQNCKHENYDGDCISDEKDPRPCEATEAEAEEDQEAEESTPAEDNLYSGKF